MQDIMEKLAKDISASTVEICAKVATIHRIPRPENEYQRGYNAAIEDIAARIRKMA
jgi:hypothetical protein